MGNMWLWIGFNIFVVAMILVDQIVFHKDDHEITIKEALTWTGIWIGLALLFNIGIYFHPIGGKEKAINFLSGYLIEKSLSIDNLFVFLVIFSYFKVENKYQHRVLFWGIIGALILRLIFILAGVALINNFQFIMIFFGLLLIYTGLRLAFKKETEVHPDKNPLIKLFRKLFKVTENYEGNKFFLKRSGKLFATPLFIVLIVIESTDVIFAMDSIPAILAITTDPFIVYSSNVFAILGLRALFFALSRIMNLFRYLNYGLAVILSFVGVKMLISYFGIHINSILSFVIILGILAITIITSLLIPEKPKAPKQQ